MIYISKLNDREIKKVNKECNLGVGFEMIYLKLTIIFCLLYWGQMKWFAG